MIRFASQLLQKPPSRLTNGLIIASYQSIYTPPPSRFGFGACVMLFAWRMLIDQSVFSALGKPTLYSRVCVWMRQIEATSGSSRLKLPFGIEALVEIRWLSIGNKDIHRIARLDHSNSELAPLLVAHLVRRAYETTRTFTGLMSSKTRVDRSCLVASSAS